MGGDPLEKSRQDRLTEDLGSQGKPMPFLGRLSRINRRAGGFLERIAVLGLFLMMAITCIDVIGSKLFRTPLFGSVDVVMLVQFIAMTFAAANTLILRRHIEVDFLIVLLPRRVQAVIDGLVSLACFALFVIVVWRMFDFGYDMQSGGEVSATARIPIYPFIYAAAVGTVAVGLVFFERFMKEIGEVDGK